MSGEVEELFLSLDKYLEFLGNPALGNRNGGTSLAAQWLRFCDSTAEGVGSIPGQGTKIPHATWDSQKKKKGNTNRNGPALSFQSTPLPCIKVLLVCANSGFCDLPRCHIPIWQLRLGDAKAEKPGDTH